MSGKNVWPAAAMAAGLVALFGCGGDRSVASKSAAAFEEAQKKGETFGGEGHGHGGHGAATPAGEHAEAMTQEPATGQEHHAGHGAVAAPAAGGQHGADHEGSGHVSEHAAQGTGQQTGGHAAMAHGQSGASPPEAAGHTGHGAPSPQAPANQADHSGHSPSQGEMPPAQAPVAALATQPAGILQPDALDTPAATSVVEAQRSAEMNQAMSGGHGGHGAGTYRHIDAGRGPEADGGSEPQTPGAAPRHQDHSAEAGDAQEATLYVCPMHPEVTSNAPGTCSKCGMTLVERREE